MKRIIYCCPYVPAEWIAAHGFEPQKIMPSAAASSKAIVRMEGFCPYAGSFLNSILMNFNACGAVVTTACDQMRRGFELLEGITKIPCFQMNVPKTYQAAARELYIEEIKRLGRFLVRLGGKSPSPARLADTMLKYNLARKVKAKRNMDNGVPVAIIGGPLMKEDFSLFDVIEKSGGRVVLDGTEGGERTICPPFDEKKIRTDALAELAGSYFAGIPDPSRRPNTFFYDWLRRELKSRAVRGIILRRYIWCDLWHAETFRIKQLTRLPVLEIDAGDQEEQLSSRTKQRICAFMETIQCEADRRK